MDFITLDGLSQGELAIIGVVGVLLLFAGYRIKKIAFFVIWFLLGFMLMQYVMPLISGVLPEALRAEPWPTLLPVVGGILVALMGFTIEKICVSGITFGLALAITVQYFGTSMQTLLIGGVVGVVVAGAAVMLMKPATIIATAVAGAYAMTLAVLGLATLDEATWYWPLLLGGGGVGAVVQFLTTRRVD